MAGPPLALDDEEAVVALRVAVSSAGYTADGRLRRRLAAFLGFALAVSACAGPSGPPIAVGSPAPAASPSASEPPRAASPARCEATREDALGPFYVPNAPLRPSVGRGYVLSGTVRATGACQSVAGARIEFWLANPDGAYDDAHRATMASGAQGEYRFESNVPVPYGGRPPHIHVRVSAPGFRTLVTQHYPSAGQTAAVFDLVLVPQ